MEPPPFRLLVLKTGALGDVLRTTSILTGLEERHGAGLEITWVTARAARPLLAGLAETGRIARLIDVDPKAVPPGLAADLVNGLAAGSAFDQVLSLDDEEPMCALATEVVCPGAVVEQRSGAFDAQRIEERIVGAYLDATGERRYTRAAGPWFDMGLLSRRGKDAADALKVQNHKSHPQIYADMFGIAPGQPGLPLLDREESGAADFYSLGKLGARGPVIGLNTGAGGRWTSKTMPLREVVRLIEHLHRSMAGQVHFLLLGGPSEAERNQTIAMHAANLADPPHVVDGGSENSLGEFAALIDRLDLLISSDSLALHLAIARRRPIVSFFAPTSAAEIELYGLGEKVLSTARDYCSYRKDADNSTLTAERIGESALRVLGTKVS